MQKIKAIRKGDTVIKNERCGTKLFRSAAWVMVKKAVWYNFRKLMNLLSYMQVKTAENATEAAVGKYSGVAEYEKSPVTLC